ncbi:MAG TPA: c-type cytochrome [Conexibacter sp.]|nr:c-type cytochrome [Conexibacter sp.]
MSAGARIAALAALAWALGAAAASASQPPIVRPGNEARLSTPELGRELFAANCARCHGPLGQGRFAPSPGIFPNGGQGPPLLGVGRQAADFYLRTGRMPLREPHEQPERTRVELTAREIAALEGYVAALGGGPPIPAPDPARGNLAQGFQLFTEHCAGCHQAVAAGGVVTGARVPPLDQATPTQVAEAVRIGPYVMPSFSRSDISDVQLDSLVRYVEYARRPDDAGGWGIGHLGPFPEGMVTWLIAAVLLVAACVLIGERLRRS